MSETPSFLDMPGVALDRADAVIVPVPFEQTVSFGKGTERGPEAVLRAGPHLETFDEELREDVADLLALATLEALGPKPGERSEAFLPRLRDTVAGLGLAPPFPIFLGGEHSISWALLAGLRGDARDVTVVHLDAHADLRESYAGSRQNHACALRRVLDLDVRRLVSIGIRSTNREEFELAESDPRIVTHYAHRLQDPRYFSAMLEDLRAIEGPVYLTVDIDGLDGALCPATGTPQPGGLTWYQSLEILRAVLRSHRSQTLGADIVEVVPMQGSQLNEMVAAKLAFKILGYRFAP